MTDSFKGYFLGASGRTEGDNLLLCFRDTETRELRFGFYEGWKTKEYIIVPEQRLKHMKALIYEGVITMKKGKSHRIRFTEPPKESEKPYAKYPELKALEVTLADFRDRTKLYEAISDLEPGYFNTCPDRGTARTHEDAFCEDCGMRWQQEYEVSAGRPVRETPGGEPIFELKSMEPTEKVNKNVGVMAYDIETDVLRWTTTCLSYVAWVPTSETEGKFVHKSFLYPPKSWEKTAEEFKAMYIDRIEDDAVARDAKDLKLPEITVCADDVRDFYVRVKREFQNAVNGWCDVFSGYNNRSYDQREMYREIKRENRLWREHWDNYAQNFETGEAMTKNEFSGLRNMELVWRGKGGYKASFHPAPDGSTVLSSPFTLNLDVYKLMKGEMGSPLPIMHKRLEDFEKRYGIAKNRTAELEGLHIWMLQKNPELTPGVLIHNLNDVDSTLYFARRLTDRLVEGDLFTALTLENGEADGT